MRWRVSHLFWVSLNKSVNGEERRDRSHNEAVAISTSRETGKTLESPWSSSLLWHHRGSNRTRVGPHAFPEITIHDPIRWSIYYKGCQLPWQPSLVTHTFPELWTETRDDINEGVTVVDSVLLQKFRATRWCRLNNMTFALSRPSSGHMRHVFWPRHVMIHPSEQTLSHFSVNSLWVCWLSEFMSSQRWSHDQLVRISRVCAGRLNSTSFVRIHLVKYTRVAVRSGYFSITDLKLLLAFFC